ncbi:unnamed protein product [Rhizopus stolonifer]
MSFIQEFCSQIKEAHVNQNAEAFYQLMSINPSNPIMTQLQGELYKADLEQVQTVVDSTLEDTSFALAECIMNYFEAVWNFQTINLEAFFDVFANFYSSLVPVFSSQDTFYLLPTINTLSTYLVGLAFEVDSYGLMVNLVKQIQLPVYYQKCSIQCLLIDHQLKHLKNKAYSISPIWHSKSILS